MMIVAVGRRAPIDVATMGVFCSFGNNFQTAAPSEDAHEHDAGIGLFETASDVNNCATRAAAAVDSLEGDAETYYRKKYGAAVTFLSSTMVFVDLKHPEPPDFAADQDFYRNWRTFVQAFKAWKRDWDETTITILSADAYRECQKWDVEQKAWWDNFYKRGIKPTAPKTVTPSALPGVIPGDKPEDLSKPGSGTDIPWGWIAFAGVLIGAGVLFNSMRGTF